MPRKLIISTLTEAEIRWNDTMVATHNGTPDSHDIPVTHEMLKRFDEDMLRAGITAEVYVH